MEKGESGLQISCPSLLRSVAIERGRLVIGTAQLTQAYGLYGAHAGRDSAAELLALAADKGIRAFDTAALYGDAETEIGRLLPRMPGIEVITKCGHVPANAADKAALIDRSLRASMERLGLTRIPVFLLHNMDAFDGAVARKLDAIRQAGLATRVGVSVYSGEEIDRVLAHWSPDVVQLPLNLFDQRLIESGHIAALRARGVEIHVRSAYLQGVLLAAPATLPPWLRELQSRLRAFIDEAGEPPAGRAAACLGFVAQVSGVDRIVVGVQNCEQLRQLVAAADAACCVERPERFAVNDPALVDPSRWPR